MKRNIFAKILATAAVLASFVFTSCYDNIYDLIEKEVMIDESGLDGDMGNIVIYKGHLFTSNGRIFTKTAQPSNITGKHNHQWRECRLPEYITSEEKVASNVFFLAADEENLYALSYTWYESNDGDNKPRTARIYVTSTEPDMTASGNVELTWEKVDLSEICESDRYKNAKTIFDNKVRKLTYGEDEAGNAEATISTSGRKAYAQIKDKDGKYGIYQLNGTSAPALVTTDNFVDDKSDSGNTINCVNFNGTDWFSRYFAMDANEKYIYYSKSYTYNSKGSITLDNDIFYFDGDKANTARFSAKKDVLSISCANNGLLLGTTNGLKRVEFDIAVGNEKKPAKNADFHSNGDNIFSEYVFMTFILDPEKDEDHEDSETTNIGTDEYAANTIYGSISSSADSIDKVGLYAYYPRRYGKDANGWNRDGN